MGKSNLLMVIVAVVAIVIVGVIVTQKSPDVADYPDRPPIGVSDSGTEPASIVKTPPVAGDSPVGRNDFAPPSMPSDPPADFVAPDPGSRFTDRAELRQAIFGDSAQDREAGLMRLSQMLDKAGSEQPDPLGDGLDLLDQLFDSKDRNLEDEALALMPNLDEAYRSPFILKGLDHEDPEYRLDSLSLVRDMATVDVSEVLMKGLRDAEPEVLEEVADLFFYFLDKPIYEPVREGLRHANEMVREEAFHYLEDTHTARSVEILILEALTSEFDNVRSGAGEALRFITDAELFTDDPNEWLQWWRDSPEAERWRQEEALRDDEL